METNKTRKQSERLQALFNEVLSTGGTSRVGLAGKFDLSLSAVNAYVSDLIDMRLIREDRSRGAGGTGRSAMLRVNPDYSVAVALVVHRSTAQIAVVNPQGVVLWDEKRDMALAKTKDSLLESILSLVQAGREEAARRGASISGIGVGMGGRLDQRNGISHFNLYTKNWHDVDVCRIIEEKFRIRCFVIRVATAVVVGEKYFGLAAGYDHFASVWVSEGLSLGLYLNGRPYLGQDGFLGEFGHINAVDDGPLCFCGNNGCLETVTKEDYIVHRCVEALKAGVDSEVLSLSGYDIDRVTVREAVTAANRGDRLSRNVFREVAEILGRKLGEILTILNPGLVTFRGSVVDGNDFLFENLRTEILNHSLRPVVSSVRFAYAPEDDDICARGLAGWVFSKALEFESV